MKASIPILSVWLSLLSDASIGSLMCQEEFVQCASVYPQESFSTLDQQCVHSDGDIMKTWIDLAVPSWCFDIVVSTLLWMYTISH